jgi:hypothetical protein
MGVLSELAGPVYCGEIVLENLFKHLIDKLFALQAHVRTLYDEVDYLVSMLDLRTRDILFSRPPVNGFVRRCADFDIRHNPIDLCSFQTGM